MNIMFAQAILQKESMRCGFVTGHDQGTLWVACRKMPQNKGGLYRLRKNSIWKESWFYTEGGGGFNPRITPIKSMGAFRPGGVFSANYTDFLSFSATCGASAGSFFFTTTVFLSAPCPMPEQA
jgi:hypothetical protein